MNGYTEEQKDKLRGPRMNDDRPHATEGFTLKEVQVWTALVATISLLYGFYLAWLTFGG